MGWNGNDIEYLSTIDRVKRLERSTLKPNESGDYDETSPNLTERVVALEEAIPTVYKDGDTLPTPEVGTSHTYHVISDGTEAVGSISITIDGENVYGGGVYGTTLLVTNSSSLGLIIRNLDNTEGELVVSNLTISSSHLSLKRVA